MENLTFIKKSIKILDLNSSYSSIKKLNLSYLLFFISAQEKNHLPNQPKEQPLQQL